MRTDSLLALLLVLGAVFFSPASAEAKTHRVKRGETPSEIAARYRVNAADLLALNGLRSARSVRAGQELDIPERGVAYARRGDTLSSIAQRSDCSVDDLRRINRLRSTRVRVGQRFVLPGHTPAYQPREWGEPAEPGVITITRGDRRERIHLVDEEGRVLAEGLAKLATILRREDEGDDALREVDPRLAYLLATLSDHFGGRTLSVVSGFRDAERYTEESSRHVANAAADIQIAGVPHRNIWEQCRRLEGAGCGFYPNSVFVHVDARDRRRQWVDWSGPGDAPRYGNLEGPVRRGGSRAFAYPAVEGVIPQDVEVVGRVPTASPGTERAVIAVAHDDSFTATGGADGDE